MYLLFRSYSSYEWLSLHLSEWRTKQKIAQYRIIFKAPLQWQVRFSCRRTLTFKDYSLLVTSEGAYCPLRAHPSFRRASEYRNTSAASFHPTRFGLNPPICRYRSHCPWPRVWLPPVLHALWDRYASMLHASKKFEPTDSFASIFSAEIVCFWHSSLRSPRDNQLPNMQSRSHHSTEGAKARSWAIPLGLGLAVEIYLATGPKDERMEGLRVWVHNGNRFRMDVLHAIVQQHIKSIMMIRNSLRDDRMWKSYMLGRGNPVDHQEQKV